MSATICPKCQGKMTQGFVPDLGHGTLISRWHPGAPQKSSWYGTKTRADEGLPIGAFRCAQCGYLEFYAAPEFAAQ